MVLWNRTPLRAFGLHTAQVSVSLPTGSPCKIEGMKVWQDPSAHAHRHGSCGLAAILRTDLFHCHVSPRPRIEVGHTTRRCCHSNVSRSTQHPQMPRAPSPARARSREPCTAPGSQVQRSPGAERGGGPAGPPGAAQVRSGGERGARSAGARVQGWSFESWLVVHSCFDWCVGFLEWGFGRCLVRGCRK